MGTFSGFFPAMGWMSGSPSWQAWQVNQLDTEHQTALMWAAALGHSSVVQGLIGRDAKAGQPGSAVCRAGQLEGMPKNEWKQRVVDWIFNMFWMPHVPPIYAII